VPARPSERRAHRGLRRGREATLAKEEAAVNNVIYLVGLVVVVLAVLAFFGLR
jgi:hypothetical protein